jgi:hypothetical protein
MTKAFLHGRTEAIRTVQPESVAFVKVRRTRAEEIYLVRLNFCVDFLLRDRDGAAKSCGAADRLQEAYATHQGLLRRPGSGSVSTGTSFLQPRSIVHHPPSCHDNVLGCTCSVPLPSTANDR